MSLSGLIFIFSNLILLFIIFVDFVNSSSCQTKCGKIEIPYPFGMGEGCYMEKWYEIKCVNNNTPFLSALGKEVVNISLPHPHYNRMPYGSVRIKYAITSKGCSNHKEGDSGESVLNLTGTPFFVSSKNELVAVGCNNKASLTNVESSMVGCTSTCTTPTTTVVIHPYYYDEERYKNEGICNGTRCCHAFLPDSCQQIVGVSIDDNTSTTTTTTVTERGCKVAFLTDEPFSLKYRSNYSKQIHAKGYSLVEIAWFIHTTNLSFLTSLGCPNANEYDQLSSRAIRRVTCIYFNFSSEYLSYSCPLGFTGNPFIPGGCKAELNGCQGAKRSCLNTEICVSLQQLRYHQCVPAMTMIKIIALSLGLGLLIIISGIYWLVKFIKWRKKIYRKRKYFKRNGGLLLQQQLHSTESNVDKTRIFTSKELEKATGNFSLNRMLGQGGQGTVYKGMLVDGGIVAVKKSIAIDEDKLEEFINEVVILSQINHRNIVKLLGCCLETEVPILVYEFIPNGNLFEHLHDDLEDSTITTWKVRLRIAVDIAGALSYLHSAASFPIYHRDIKSTNIMLDAKYRAKVSDFGTSRSVTLDHTHLTTVVSGTAGYLDPEYFQSSQFTDKSDVYSFGVVLVELITGAKPFSFLRSQENRALAAYFIVSMKENRLDEIIDARIKDDCNMEQVMATAKLARSCLNRKGKKRPSMREVSTELERIRSSETDLEAQVFIVESDEEEHVHIEVESWNDVDVAAASTSSFEVATTSFVDAQPLFPRQTW